MPIEQTVIRAASDFYWATYGDGQSVTGIIRLYSTSRTIKIGDGVTNWQDLPNALDGFWERVLSTLYPINDNDNINIGTGTFSGGSLIVTAVTGIVQTASAEQINITKVGTLQSLLMGGNIDLGTNDITNATNITGTNLYGLIQDWSQPNIKELGEMAVNLEMGGHDIDGVQDLFAKSASIGGTGNTIVSFFSDTDSNVKLYFQTLTYDVVAVQLAYDGSLNIGDQSGSGKATILWSNGSPIIDLNADWTIGFHNRILSSIASMSATTIIGDLNGTINTLTTGVTQSAGDNSTKIATTAYVNGAIHVDDGSLVASTLYWNGSRWVPTATLSSDGTSVFVDEGFLKVWKATNNPQFSLNYSDGSPDFTIHVDSPGNTTFDVTGYLQILGDVTVPALNTISGGTLTDGTISITGGNLTGATGVTATNLTGTLQTAAQPNITSVGTLTGLLVANNVVISVPTQGEAFSIWAKSNGNTDGLSLVNRDSGNTHTRLELFGNNTIQFRIGNQDNPQYPMKITGNGAAGSFVGTMDFNSDYQNMNHIIRKLTTGSAYIYDAGDDTHTFSGNILYDGTLNGADLYSLGTGVLEGLELTVNAVDDTKLDIAEGVVLIVDYSNPLTPAFTRVVVPAQTISPGLTGSWNKWLGINVSGTIVPNPEFTAAETREYAGIGRCWGSGIDDVIKGSADYKTAAFGQAKTAEDLSKAIGAFNDFGNIYGPNGLNLLVNKSAGSSYRFGAHYGANPQSPNIPPFGDLAQVGIAEFYYHLQGAVASDILPAIEPNYYDLLGVKTAVPAGKFTLQRQYYFPGSQVAAVTYGQKTYSSMSATIFAAGFEDLTLSLSLLNGSVLRGWIALAQGTTDLTNPLQAVFIEASSMSEPRAKATESQGTCQMFFESPANITTTIIAQDAWTLLNTNSLATGGEEENITVGPDGVSNYDGESVIRLAADGNIRLEPALGTNQSLSVSFFGIFSANRTVTFDNTTNIVSEIATPMQNNFVVTFLKTTSTLPAELFPNIFYYVVNKTTDSFQLSYTIGGPAITFTDNGTGTHTYSFTRRGGATASNTVSINAPADFIPQALGEAHADDKMAIGIRNSTSANDILSQRAWYRLIKA